VAVMEYVYLVPHIEETDHLFLKTVIPSRKAMRDYGRRGEQRSDSTNTKNEFSPTMRAASSNQLCPRMLRCGDTVIMPVPP
jgi:hypothetical protein